MRVLKARRNNRVIRVERRVKIAQSTAGRVWASEDSDRSERRSTTPVAKTSFAATSSFRCHYNFADRYIAVRAKRGPDATALVSTRLALSDIARRVTLRVLVAVVDWQAGSPTRSWLHEQRTAARSTASGASTDTR